MPNFSEHRIILKVLKNTILSDGNTDHGVGLRYGKLEKIRRLSQKPVLLQLFRAIRHKSPQRDGWDQATRGWFILLAMRVTLIQISPHVASKDGFEALTAVYVQRCSAFARFDTRLFRTGQAMLDWLDRRQGRTAAVTVLCDPRGRQMSSEAFAKWLGIRRDQGAQHIAFAVGPPDGWSNAARERAGLLLSLGPLTLPHPLARLVLAEQVYRAFTILAGHPYHTGH
jgi:23S rRNA (pseudouridine1915-N3)-methyltransferase